MTFPEMIYQTIVFFFGGFWPFVKLLIFVIAIRGLITMAGKLAWNFGRSAMATYKAKLNDAERKELNTYRAKAQSEKK